MMEIIEKIEQPLLERQVIKMRLGFEGVTPARKQVLADAAKALKVKEDLLTVIAIRTFYGRSGAMATLHLYKSAENAAKYEPAYRGERITGKKEKAAKEAKPEGEDA